MIDDELLADVKRVRRQLIDELLEMQEPGGYWTGELSTSALSTATTCVAFEMLMRAGVVESAGQPLRPLIDGGLKWLAENVNEDGGWGDTVKSKSNISTTTLCRAALTACTASRGRQSPDVLNGTNDDQAEDNEQQLTSVIANADAWIAEATQGHPSLSAAIVARYGKDKTFSVPILMQCALAGVVDWREIPRLPFELAVLPHRFYAAVKLPVVSYALPALIAIGQLLHKKNPTWFLPLRWFRSWSIDRTLRKLISLQPEHGGFLEAAPLTGFVTMALAAAGRPDHIVAQRGASFLVDSVRDDGSWPIDTNLSTWVTTLIVNALGDSARDELPNPDATLHWLLDQQHTEVHPFTQAAPGGWAWTPLPGGVPDADDTAGAIRAIVYLAPKLNRSYIEDSVGSRRTALGDDDDTIYCFDEDEFNLPDDVKLLFRCRSSIWLGSWWLAGLQNRDGGVPTFCRGWGTLPFDRSSCDITAHALLAMKRASRFEIEQRNSSNSDRGKRRAFQENTQRFLIANRNLDGSWLPLWFGNELCSPEENRVYGTARVMLAMSSIQAVVPEDNESNIEGLEVFITTPLNYLVSQINSDGGVGGGQRTRSTIEEASVASDAITSALKALAERQRQASTQTLSVKPRDSVSTFEPWMVEQPLRYLVEAIDRGDHHDAQPIGFYFAKLWYFEKLYPYAFALGALQAAVDAFDRKRNGEQGVSTP